ncbi:SH3 and cysteine-rich domain-containing protein 2-like [Ruditapes philippinarum]|uniref:SH3 and cysteine-rich domain-containing protein 2-like n=1 Tax=Ruditapes philippinarum TaxID=129788 RepID=UPI00295BCAEF|nr:SH3 and cysteine-rich domain-containing protein 2-like [Ruditapes philippinarum]
MAEVGENLEPNEIELLTPKQNGSMDDDQEKKNPSTIRGMWKKAFKTLKSSSSVEKLSKKSSFSKKKQSSKDADDEVEQLSGGPVDPVYSLLKCAADLPRSGGKSPCLLHQHCSGQHTPAYVRYPSGGDSSGNTSKTSSPSSSVSHSPKTRRKKLNARMKSFSLDTPEPPKQLLGIDESTKKKSSSFTNTCFGVGTQSPEEKFTFSASSLRKKFAFAKASSLEIEEKKNRSFSPSPKGSPKSQKKEIKNLYVALYNFKAKEKDDIDLRAGWRVNVTDSSKKDWWKGKTHGRTGYFPATYVIPLQLDQRVFQVLQPLNLSDGNYSIKFHKDQIVLQIGEEVEGMILVRAANNRQALCPLLYLQEL